MNVLKRIFALVLCLALTITCLTGCHKKGELAVKVGDVEYSSGYYACALVFADSEARAKVEETLSDDKDIPENFKYWDYKVEDTEYVKWVEQTTLNNLKRLAAVKTLCAEAKVTLSSENESLANTTADYYWDSYGYSALMESNGVSKETFKTYMRDSYLVDEYFEYLYGKGGEKEVAADQVSKQLTDNYVLANKLDASFSSLSEDEKTNLTNRFTAYEKDLNNKTKTFEEIYLEFNNISAEDHKHDEPAEGELAPIDLHASVLGAKETSYASDHFETAKAMAVGEVKVITLTDGSGLVLLVKQDIAADPYYIEEFDALLRQDIVGDAYTDDLDKYGKELECTVVTSSTKRFKVKKLIYPETTY